MEHDSWAQTPVSEAGPLLSAEMKRYGDLLLAWQFAFFALRDPHPSRMTCLARPSCHRPGCFGARRATLFAVSQGTSKGVFL
jgi:hypothetical protein